MLRRDQRQSTAHGTVRSVSVLDRRLYLFGGLIDIPFESSSGRRFLRDEIDHAIRRLREANHYLLTGEASRHIRVRGSYGGPDVGPLKPVFWWREGEVGEINRRLSEERRLKALSKRQARKSSGEEPKSA